MRRTHPEYDELDEFVNDWLHPGEMPVPLVKLDPEMVEFYKTPARVVLDLVGRIVTIFQSAPATCRCGRVRCM